MKKLLASLLAAVLLLGACGGSGGSGGPDGGARHSGDPSHGEERGRQHRPAVAGGSGRRSRDRAEKLQGQVDSLGAHPTDRRRVGSELDARANRVRVGFDDLPAPPFTGTRTIEPAPRQSPGEVQHG